MNIPQHYTPPGARKAKLHYYLHLPKPNATLTDNGWPLIVFLHGSGERGRDLRKLRQHGLPKRIAQGHDIPAIVVSPQCPLGSWWTPHFGAIMGLIDTIVTTQKIDPKRIYLTGLSMGGYGCWELASRYPQRFAAIVPICGGGRKQFGFPARVNMLRHMPIWAFHGALDAIVPPHESEILIKTLRRCGGSPRYTLYPDLAHNCWSAAYAEPALFAWLFEQKMLG